jgi:arginase
LRTEAHAARAHIIQVPYDSGHRNFRMGLGPARLAEAGLGSIPGVSLHTIEVEARPFELGTTVKVLRSISEKVRLATQDHCFPMLLAGGCISTVGALGGLNPDPGAVIWFDAHADFNTPETTVSGFIDGMALAAASGRCWRNLTASIPGFHPVPEPNLVLIGARQFDPDERQALLGSAIAHLDTLRLRHHGWEESLAAAVRKLPERVYLHVDLDVLDRSEAVVNEYSSPGGLTLRELLQIIRLIGHQRAIVGAAITAYDPAVDRDGKAANAGIAVAKELLAAACIDLS